ncbi:hypothetical protein SELMODRAFT_133867 [Selaginella moellendorffii]|uniref:Glycosyltransferase n=1 Tax=Selaginella moellendorffii TaxID=88036 RepID=D8T7M1_SELML|nr:hypothetical protein SELMODRAFT_133867 [Selaginella moellendorffii]
MVVLPYPALGHLLPLIHLATKLATTGIIVTLLNVDSIHENLSRQWRCPDGMDIRLEQVHCDVFIPCGIDAKALKDTDGLLESLERLQIPVEELVREMQPPPCCIISDYFMRWAVGITKKLGLKVVTFWPGNAAWSSIHHHTQLLVSSGDANLGLDENKLIRYVPGLDAFRCRHLPSYFRRKLVGFILEFFSVSADRMKDADWILVNSISELETHAFDAMQGALANKNFVSVGPLFPCHTSPRVSLRDEKSECLEWLHTQATTSVLYISFGSLCLFPERQIVELAAGLEASKQPFLWADVRHEFASSEALRGFAERSRPRGMVVSWAPQLQVLAHHSIAGFLSHCGWNSVLESIFYGVPLLGWPCHTEQSMNCKLVEDWKIGRRLSDDQDVARGRVEEVIRDFLEGQGMGEIRARMAALRSTVRSTTDQGGTSHENLKRFADAVNVSAIAGATWHGKSRPCGSHKNDAT